MSENSLASAIVPRSDQLNADDLIAGPRTIVITGVSVRATTEQPVSVSFVGDNGRPWKPCKSMCRVLVTLWGPDANAYTGRSLTLYCDPSVKWGGVAVGGIRISHASHIGDARTLSLTVTRGQRRPFTVKALAESAQDTRQRTLVGEATKRAGMGTDAFRLWWKELPAADREHLKPSLPHLQSVAAKTDAERARQSASDDPGAQVNDDWVNAATKGA